MGSNTIQGPGGWRTRRSWISPFLCIVKGSVFIENKITPIALVILQC